MSERITAYTLDVRPVVYDRVTRTPLYAGGGEPKSHFTAHNLITDASTSFVQRVFDMRYIRNWKRMNDVGLPVVPEILLNPERDFVLTTDVKADGSEVYGKGLRQVLDYSHKIRRERPRPEIDKIFLKLTDPQNIHMIEQAAQATVDRANAHAVELPFEDTMELLVHPDGSWGIILLDLNSARTEETTDESEIRSRVRMNENHCETTMYNLIEIRKTFTC